MTSVSGLSYEHRVRARDRAVQAAVLALNHRDAIHYSQGSRRWDGIRLHKNARLGQYPIYADCSAFVSWCIWNGLKLSGYTDRDTVNGANWTGGYTGTMLTHGKSVQKANVIRGDAVIYGNGAPGHHTAMVVGVKNGVPMCIGHGSERGPLYHPYNYRSDVLCFRRFI